MHNINRKNHKKRGFFTVFSILFILILAMSVIIMTILESTGIRLVQFSDGTIMLGEPERAAGARPQTVLPPVSLPITDIPRPSVPVTVLPGTAEPLTYNEIYKKNVESVTVILSESGYGVGSGTGIVMSAEGYIITNNHVVEGADIITVILHDGKEYDAVIVGTDRISDLAVLHIDTGGLSPAEFGNSDVMEQGDPVAAIGNPLGIELRNTITAGIISGVNRDITLKDSSGEITMNVLQTNCAVNPGNSGGPLLNQYGQIIGIISSKIMSSASQSVEGLGFAIPINTAAPIISQLIENGYVRGRPALGIKVDVNYDEQTAEYYGLPAGVRVMEVTENSGAAEAGLKIYDIITHIDGTAVKGIEDVNAIKLEHTAGDVLRLTVYRQGETFDLDLTLMEEGSFK